MKNRPKQHEEVIDLEADEKAVRAFATAHDGSITINTKFIEMNLPKEIVIGHIKGKDFTASDWHNLRAVAMNEGRVITG